jgi:hypothetical protein
MLLAAAEEMEIDLSASWMVGDSQRDMEAGHSAGCRTILLRSTSAGAEGSGTEEADYVAVNIREAANMIKKFHRSGREESPREDSAVETESVSSSEYSVTPLEAEELRSAPTQAETAGAPEEAGLVDPDTPQLLTEILEQLKRMEKTEMFGEFSIMRLLAGIVQVFVLFCLLMGLWFLMRGDREVDVLMALGFGTVLQAMALTFYIMQGRR